MKIYNVIEVGEDEVLGVNSFRSREDAVNHAVKIIVETESSDEDFSGDKSAISDAANDVFDSYDEYCGEGWSVTVFESELD